MSEYDSTAATLTHIRKVNGYLLNVIVHLTDRAMRHDNSKLVDPEKKIFDKYTPLLSSMTYGSDEYKKVLGEMKSVIEHHNKKNRHHPEHFGEDEIRGMNLIDLTEMICDWKAASERHKDGNIFRSLQINKERFKMSDELTMILYNTVIYLWGDK